MGQTNSVDWRNQNAKSYLPFLVSLFGEPCIYLQGTAGFAMWSKDKLSQKSLFGKSIYFEKVIVKDDTGVDNDFIYIYLRVPKYNCKKMSQILLIPNVRYDAEKGLIWIKCSSLETAIVLSKTVCDVLNNKITIQDVIYKNTIGSLMKNLQTDDSSTGNINISVLKNMYTSVYVFLVGSQEGFRGDAWYSTNNPLDLATIEKTESEYYQTIDDYMKNKNVSKCSRAYPRAPTGKPTIENFYNMGQEQKLHRDCKGACAKRFNKMKSENLINFNAYKHENLINFNAYDLKKKTNF